MSIESYLTYCAKLFHYDKTVVLNKNTVDIYSFLDIEVPIDSNHIQTESFEYIRNYIYKSKSVY